MAFRRRKGPAPEPRHTAVQPRTIVAAATRFDFEGKQTWRTFRGGDMAWQADAWYQYDICGELRYAVNWLGNAASLADLYAADVDEDTGKPAQPTDNDTARAIAREILGGPAARAQGIRSIIVNIMVPGELFIVLRSEPDGEDRWLVLSSTQIKGGMGGDVQFTDPLDGLDRKLTADDLIIRIWSPHPRAFREADSSVRASLPTLREIERTSQNIAARLDSRLASAGVLILPESVEFPREEDDPDGKADAFMVMLARAMSASLSEPGNAATQVPITITVPDDVIDSIKHLTFDTPVSAEVLDLREKAIQRLATGLDLPGEMLTGMSGANHWGAWQIEESTYKTHLAPVLDRIADDLTTGYYRPALTAAGITDPDRYMLAFDATAIIARSDELEKMRMLHDRILISDAALRDAAAVSEDQAPDDDEQQRRLARSLVEQAATLVADPRIAKILGLPPIDAAAAGVSGAPSGVLPADEQPTGEQRGIPAEPTSVDPSPEPQPVQASAMLAADIAVEHALAKAGARLLNANRVRGQYADTPQHEIHTRVRPADDQLGALLAGAWDGSARTVADQYRLDGYTRVLLASGTPHTAELLTRWVRATDTMGRDAPPALVAAAVTGG